MENINVEIHSNRILTNINIQIRPREIVALIGPNGAGKSTLVRVLLGLIQPSVGQIYLKPGIKIGYMPQKIIIPETMPLTVERFITLGTPSPRKVVKKILDEVGAAAIIDLPAKDISGGELQRVLLARALLRQPELLVLDEPIQGVDLNGQYELYDLIGTLPKKKGCGILVVSHDLHLVMINTDYVICLNKHICCSGQPEYVAKDPAYLELFGMEGVKTLAIYHHKHNHRHDTNGNILG